MTPLQGTPAGIFMLIQHVVLNTEIIERTGEVD
jgi:hypothetical protein